MNLEDIKKQKKYGIFFLSSICLLAFYLIFQLFNSVFYHGSHLKTFDSVIDYYYYMSGNPIKDYLEDWCYLIFGVLFVGLLILAIVIFSKDSKNNMSNEVFLKFSTDKFSVFLYGFCIVLMFLYSILTRGSLDLTNLDLVGYLFLILISFFFFIFFGVRGAIRLYYVCFKHAKNQLYGILTALMAVFLSAFMMCVGLSFFVAAGHSAQITVDDWASDSESYDYSASSGKSSHADNVVQDIVNDAVEKENSSSSVSHSETYVQVDGIDEADIVKTDGHYIYYISKDDSNVHIVKADKGKLEETCSINWANFDMNPKTMFLDNNKLIIIGDVDQLYNYNYDMNDMNIFGKKQVQSFNNFVTMVSVYDLKDKVNPERVYSFAQFGEYKTARYFNHQLYLISEYNGLGYYDYYDYDDDDDYQLIRPAYSDNGNSKNISMHDVYYLDYMKSSYMFSSDAFTTVSSIDMNNQKAISSKAVCGDINDIYMNQKNLYFAMDNSHYSNRRWSNDTAIIKINLADGKLNFGDVINVPGEIHNQYSMDEYDGYFRVATTTTGSSWVKGNHIFIIDSKLDIVGHIDKLAYNEDIKAVRYMGDVAYVITYRNTDPLFVLDLSNPKSPFVKGEVKITGFSSMLEPIGKDRILGIGYATGSGFVGDGLKLCLFDVSNPYEPKVLSAIEKEGMVSDVQEDPHALLKNADENYYGFAYTLALQDIYDDDMEDDIIEEDIIEEDIIEEDITGEDLNDETEKNFDDWTESDDVTEPDEVQEEVPKDSEGVCIFEINKDKINIKNQYKLKNKASRVVYIDDYIYAICDNGSVESIHLK